MLITSLDLLYFVIAICLVSLTAFIVWGIYYLVRILRDLEQMLAKINSIVGKIEKAVNAVEAIVTTGKGQLDKVAKIADFYQSTVDKFAKKKSPKSKKSEKSSKK